jgi:ATP-dependent Clp protease ATP-binding subunit ClpC
MKDRRARCNFLFVVMESFGRKIAFSPNIPNVWFEVNRGDSLNDRATEVLTRHFRDQEREKGKHAPRAEALSVDGKAWSTTLDLDVQPPRLAPKLTPDLFALLGGQETLDGDRELHRVGRRLDDLYPDELDRAILRDKEVAELVGLLTSPERSPVLMVGPRLAGKTAIIHECVYQMIAREKKRPERNTWLLAPQRLISGMSYVGQWENRFLAILDEAKKHGHVLYFDDFLGLFQAGRSSSSTLTVADVLKPYAEKREIRILAEMTPAALRVFREQDRGFAEQFHLIRVGESDERDTVRILVHLVRQLEAKNRCQFGVEALPMVLDLQRRYGGDAAFPGKGALFLKQLAVKNRKLGIPRDAVMAEFSSKSGLPLSFLNERATLSRKEIVSGLAERVIGQDGALQACADVVLVAKARLNDRGSPLGSLLFLGPTGVGKTECAKSLAAYLFGDQARMLRFDMNEYASSYAAARLVGTFNEPEGLLTSAVRRQPFAVVLLDEIEKAHPDVFNLLLQVMGDGRLTDSLGRTVDFTNVILIMTSNLGVREAGTNLGFAEDAFRESSVYTTAAEKFFKPEFFNRLDRIIPFGRLSREDVEKIAHQVIDGILSRQGLAGRKCLVDIDRRAMDRVIDQGYHPRLGARALKRALEKQVTRRLADKLASTGPNTPMVIRICPAADGELAVVVDALRGAAPGVGIYAALAARSASGVLDAIDRAVDRIDADLAHLGSEGPIATDDVAPEHVAYFHAKEQALRVRRMTRWMREQALKPNVKLKSRARGRSMSATQFSMRHVGTDDLWNKTISAHDVADLMRDLGANSPPHGERVEDLVAEAAREVAFLDALARQAVRPADDRVIIYPALRNTWRDAGSVTSGAVPKEYSGSSMMGALDRLLSLHWALFTGQLGMEAAIVGAPRRPGEYWEKAVVVSGPGAAELAEIEKGTHLFYSAQGSPVLVEVDTVAMAENESPEERVARHWRERRSASGRADSDDIQSEPTTAVQPVVRIYLLDLAQSALDLRSGLMTMKAPVAGELRAFLLSVLPLPAELE